MSAPPMESMFSKSSMLGTRSWSWAEAGKATKARPTRTKIACRNNAMGRTPGGDDLEVMMPPQSCTETRRSPDSNVLEQIRVDQAHQGLRMPDWQASQHRR